MAASATPPPKMTPLTPPPLGDVASGAFLGVDLMGRIAALVVLVFSGALAGGVAIALPIMIVVVALSSLILAWRGGITLGSTTTQDVPIAILISAIAALVAGMAAPEEVRVVNALAILGLTSILMGISLWALGQFKAASLIRVLPFPVMAGFLASSGYLMVETGLLTGSGLVWDVRAPLDIWKPANINAAISIALALGLLVLGNKGAAIFTPVVLAASIAAFYGLIWAAEIAPETLQSLGLLPAQASEGRAALALSSGLLGEIDTGVLLAALPTIITATLVGIVAYLLTISGVELATDSDVDLNTEMRLTGICNIGAGLVGGAPSFLSSVNTLQAKRLGARTRWTSVALALTCLLGAGFAAPLIAVIPTFILTAIVVATGLSMMHQWLVDQIRMMPFIDWLIVGAIVLVTAVLGILPAILLGLLIATVIFSWRYGRLSIFRAATDLRIKRSTVDRSARAQRVLDEHGQLTMILILRGYLFFGSIEQLIARARLRLADRTAPLHIVVDFSLTSGIDPTACSALIKLSNLCRARHTALILSALPAGVEDMLRRAKVPIGPGGAEIRPTLDGVLEDCETEILQRQGDNMGRASLAETLLTLAPDPARLKALIAHMTRMELSPGDTLIAQGSDAGDMFFVESGRVSVMIQGDEGQARRVRSMGPGALVGEVASYTGAKRTADVVVDVASVIYVLSAQTITSLEDKDPRLAAFLHRLVATELADKLVRTTRTLTADV